MTVLAAALLATALATAFGAPPRRRLQRALPRAGQVSEQLGDSSSKAPAITASIAAALAVWWLVGGVPGAVAGVLVAAVALRVLLRLVGGRSAAERDEALSGQAADVADMLAACIASGAGLERATREVARAVPEPAADILAQAAGQLSMGADPARAWSELLAHEATAPIGRAVVRSLESGAPMADALTTCASELRDIRRARIETMAQAVAVKAVGPLGLCFLPAFLLVGVVPLVAGLLQRTVAGF